MAPNILNWSFGVSLSVCLFLCTATQGHRLVKRQNYNAPYFQQSSYNFTISNCNAGTFLASIFAYNPAGGSLAYSIDYGTGNPDQFAVNFQTGEINLATSISQTTSFNFRATNTWGAAVVPVQVQCGSYGGNTGIGILCYNNICTNTSDNSSTSTSYSFSISSCNSGVTAGRLAYSNAVAYFLQSNNNNFYVKPTTGDIISASTLSSGTYSFNVYAFTGVYSAVTIAVTVSVSGSSCSSSSNLNGNGFVCFGGYCYNSLSLTNSTTSTSFSTSSCSSGTSVGTVVINNANAYQVISGSGFSISSSGVLTLSSTLSSGTYTVTVTGYNNGNAQATTTATITVSCSGSGNFGGSIGDYFSDVSCLFRNCDYNYTAPTFAQTSYSFSGSCSSGDTIGTVTATGAGMYFVLTGPWSNYFLINPTTGVISAVGSVSGQQVVLTVTATYNGVPTSVPVLVQCAATTTSATSTTTATTTATTTGTTTLSNLTPVFSQPLGYTFTPPACTAAATVGTVLATNAVRFASSNNFFNVSPTGVITTTSAVVTGTTSFFITASSSTGVSLSVPVSVTCP